jgi:hypothetical protein
MSFWKSLFGRALPAARAGPQAVETYNGFVLRAEPFKSGSHYQTAGVIEKEIDGVRKEHRFIRADASDSFADAVAFSLAKARQIVDLQGERIFD